MRFPNPVGGQDLNVLCTLHIVPQGHASLQRSEDCRRGTVALSRCKIDASPPVRTVAATTTPSQGFQPCFMMTSVLS
jgi:hypothetical protein